MTLMCPWPPISCDGSGFPTNNATNASNPTTINFGLPNNVSSDNAVAKVDYQINQKNSLNGMYFFGNNNGTVSDSDQLQTKWLTVIHTRAQVAPVLLRRIALCAKKHVSPASLLPSKDELKSSKVG